MGCRYAIFEARYSKYGTKDSSYSKFMSAAHVLVIVFNHLAITTPYFPQRLFLASSSSLIPTIAQFEKAIHVQE